jgi:endonuclease/exonuclease/phosphatase (EEP) superfamily protein YafD
VSSRALEWAVAGGLAGWAAARLAGADRLGCAESWAVPLLSFTPQVTAGAWAGSLLLRGRGACATAALAGAALTATVAPRAMRRRQPAAGGPVLRILTANLLVGRAATGPVVDLVRSTGADVLFLQELTNDAAARLRQAGLGDLLPSQMAEPAAEGPRGSAIYARHPLRAGLAVAPERLAQATARLDLPSGQSVQLVCVHLHPPKPAWSRYRSARWRGELSQLPAPASAPAGSPLILAGDFNATVDHADFRALLRLGYVDAASQAGNGLVPTWGPAPRGRPGLLALDHVLLDPRCAVLATSAHQLPGSDHRAVYAEFALPG